MTMEEQMLRYEKNFNSEKLFEKLNRFAGKLGIKLVYQVLNMYYLVVGKNSVPLRIRLLVVAALGYFIVPTDLISDFIPALGFSDDLSFLTYAFGQAVKYMGPDIKQKAKTKLSQWFPKQLARLDLDVPD